MPSPFPGMNPYLEQNDTWEDFHQNFITQAQHVLSGQVGPNYLIKIEVRLYLHELSAEERRFAGRADVAVTDRPGNGGRPAPRRWSRRRCGSGCRLWRSSANPTLKSGTGATAGW